MVQPNVVQPNVAQPNVPRPSAAAVAETEAALRVNYNTTGVAVMQSMYSSDYLSIGGTSSTDALAAAAGATAYHRVLDIGCGVGGPALRLAEAFGCRVTGVDLLESSIEIANASARQRGLASLARFTPADATQLPYASQSFDMVWGQDAWCHVPDKTSLIAECFRVLAPKGTIAFTDWLAGEEASSPAGEKALDAAVSRHACTAAEYERLLGEAGFIDIEVVDVSDQFTRQYRQVCAGLETRQAELTEQFGERVFGIVAGTNGTILEGFESGAIAGGQFIGRVRP